MIEKMAALAHEQWSGWMKYLFSKGTINEDDGTFLLPAWAVTRWVRQMNTIYPDLPEEEKASDRKEAQRFLSLTEKENEQLRALLLDRDKRLLAVADAHSEMMRWVDFNRPGSLANDLDIQTEFRQEFYMACEKIYTALKEAVVYK